MIFSSNRTGNLEIWLSDLDGENPVQLITDDKYESNWPRVSPDRSKVLFYRAPKGTKESSYEQFSLWQLNLNDQSVQELIPQGAHGWITQGVADWSPDGTKIVMAAADKNHGWQLYITDAQGKIPVKISKRKSIFIDPSWSPDGKWIAYETEMQPLYWLLGKWALRITEVGSRKTTELLNDGHVNILPRWSPDSGQLYFHRLRFKEDKIFGLWRIDLDGSNLVRIGGSDRYKDIQADVF